MHTHTHTPIQWPFVRDYLGELVSEKQKEGLAVASIARDVVVEMTPPFFPAMRGKFGSEFET